MTKLTALKQNAVQKVLVYGPPFTGKTTLVAELSKAFNILYIGLENGHSVFFKLPPEQQARVEIVDLPDTRSYPIAIETVLKLVKGNRCVVCDAHGKIECPICKANAIKNPETVHFTTVELNALGPEWIVCYDSLTQLTNSGIAHITKNQPEDYKLQHDDWGSLGKLMDIFFSHIQQAQYNVVCISHESEAEMEDGKTKIVPVAGTRNFSRNVAKYFDHVIYAQVANAKHTFTSVTTQTMNIVAGSRTGIDMKLTGSLLPIFTGEMGTPAQSNGQKAAASLSSLLIKKA
jgi:hypothetical protein